MIADPIDIESLKYKLQRLTQIIESVDTSGQEDHDTWKRLAIIDGAVDMALKYTENLPLK